MGSDVTLVARNDPAPSWSKRPGDRYLASARPSVPAAWYALFDEKTIVIVVTASRRRHGSEDGARSSTRPTEGGTAMARSDAAGTCVNGCLALRYAPTIAPSPRMASTTVAPIREATTNEPVAKRAPATREAP